MTPTYPKSLISEGERLLARVVLEDDTYDMRQEEFMEWASLNAADLLALAKSAESAKREGRAEAYEDSAALFDQYSCAGAASKLRALAAKEREA